MKIAELEEHVDRLHRLLKSPEPGLSTWHEFVVIEVEAMFQKWHLSKTEMSIPKGLKPLSTENAREIVEALDQLVKIRLSQERRDVLTATMYRDLEEQAEVIKRRITDYLLVTDPRGGVYQTGNQPR